jgi:hypothetical protein
MFQRCTCVVWSSASARETHTAPADRFRGGRRGVFRLGCTCSPAARSGTARDSTGHCQWRETSRRPPTCYSNSRALRPSSMVSLGSRPKTLGRLYVALRCRRAVMAARTWAKESEPGNNLGTIAPEHRGKWSNRADQEARRVNKIDNPALSAKPPSPVQIRTAPPNSFDKSHGL